MAKRRDQISRARQLRREMSPPEVALWQYLRSRPAGFKFRRQHPLGPYKLDFFCHEAGLAIEVDGDAHDMGDNPERDARRDEWVARKGVKTIRFLARDVMENLDAVAAQIQEECASRCPSTVLPDGPPPLEIEGRNLGDHRRSHWRRMNQPMTPTAIRTQTPTTPQKA
jgi:very-short-patch-repair endonuclease